MDFFDIASRMYPYWISGIFMLLLSVFLGYKENLRVDKTATFSFLKFLLALTIYRLFIFKFWGNSYALQNSARIVSQIPLLVTLTVWWEDACHTLPLFLLQKILGVNKWTIPIHIVLTLAITFSFGLGHLYQGTKAAVFLSLYVPMGLHFGKKYGFGTTMLCHMIFDFVTLLSIKLLL